MSGTPMTRGQRWFSVLAGASCTDAPVWSADAVVDAVVDAAADAAVDAAVDAAADATVGAEIARFIAVVPDPHQRFARATGHVVGLEQGWRLARIVRDTIEADARTDTRRPIVAIVDVKSQAYGYREEMLGLHLACAAAVDAYAAARAAGHPVVALIVGQAMSGAFLAHGYQANRIVALDAPGIAIHAMGKDSAARVTRRSVEALDALGETITPMSYSLAAFAKLGLLDALIEGIDADAPTDEQIERVRAVLGDAIQSARSGTRDLSHRLASAAAKATRAASLEVRRHLAEQWDA
jgi:malonate decarboxylase gamma subunit